MKILNNKDLSFEQLKALIPNAREYSNQSLKMEIYLYEDDSKMISHILRVNVTSARIDGILHKVHAWSSISDGFLKGFQGVQYVNDELDGQFVTSVATLLVKWDECSHWTFSMTGEDEDHDGYYHICGLESYSDMIRGLLFPIKFGYDFEILHYPDDWEEFNKDALIGYSYAVYIRD